MIASKRRCVYTRVQTRIHVRASSAWRSPNGTQDMRASFCVNASNETLKKTLLHEPWNKIISQHTRIQIFVCWDFNIDWILSQLLIWFDWSQLSVTSASSQSAISILVTWQKWTNQRCILIYWDNGFVTSSAQLESWLAHFCHVTKILIADWLLSEVTVITTGIVLDTQRRFSS